MSELLFWILPPVIGAFIGYFTNLVAIKMLFRPLNEVRLFGLRLPFTPGILPREREKLAISIGAMVERELLTPNVVRERLALADVREKIGDGLGAYTAEVLARPLADWIDPVQVDASDVDANDNSVLQPKDPQFNLAGEILRDFVNSEVFNFLLEELIRNWIYRNSDGSGDNKIGAWFKSRFLDFGSLFVSPTRDIIKKGLVKELDNPGGTSIFMQAMEAIVNKYPGITLGEFLALRKPKKQSFDLFITDKAVHTLDENIERALSTVDIKTLVTERINSLDMIRVEKIILDVMAGQLKWINLFGGIIGALIGFVQVLLNLIMRQA